MNQQEPETETIYRNSEENLRHETAKVIEAVLPFSQSAHYRKNDVVMAKGEQSRCLYYVQEGTVEVSHTLHETRIAVALIGAGDFFGEIGFFDNSSRVRDIRAIDRAVVHFFDEPAFQQIQQTDPVLYGDFLTLIARNICGKFRRILREREPLTAYAASLSTGGRSFDQSAPLPDHFFETPEWHFLNRVVEDLKARFYDVSYRLQENGNEDIPESLQRQCHDLLTRFNDRLREAHDRFDKPEIVNCTWGYVFKEIFPYFMRSRFAERAYFKPKGYAGDFLMMEMIYGNKPSGDGKLGLLVDDWCLNTAAARAVRGRRRLLKKQIRLACDKRSGEGNPIRIMNLACGSNREFFDFLSDCDYTRLIEATCIDADPQALEYTARHVNLFPHEASIRLMNDNVIKWSLGRIHHHYGPQDIIYSAGLTDYLDHRLFRALAIRCHAQLKPGGVLIIGNFGPANPNRAFMDHVLHWRLIHRSEDELKDLFAGTPFKREVRIMSEGQGLNLFAIATKSL